MRVLQTLVVLSVAAGQVCLAQDFDKEKIRAQKEQHLRNEPYGLPFPAFIHSNGKMKIKLVTTYGRLTDQSMISYLLKHEDIRNEIEILDEQDAEFRKHFIDMQRRVDERFGEFDQADLSTGLSEEINTFTSDLRDEAKHKLDEILLPHQRQRLNKLYFQRKTDQMSFVDVLLSEEMGEFASISEDQQDKIRGSDKVLKKELERKIAQLTIEYRNELMSELSPEQRDKVKEAFGEEFFELPRNKDR